MRVKYVDLQNIYLISNHCVALNAMFDPSYYSRRFKNKVKDYLLPLCEILALTIHDNQFQLVVKLRARSDFETYYINKEKKKGREISKIPESTYIFSQAMANLQSSMAIHFNRREGRTGAVFARRFTKVLIKTGKELKRWLDRMLKFRKFHLYKRQWKSRVKSGSENGVTVRREEVERLKERFKNWNYISELQGQSEKPKNGRILNPVHTKINPKIPPI